MRKVCQLIGVEILTVKQLDALREAHRKHPQRRFVIARPKKEETAIALERAFAALPYVFVTDEWKGEETLDLSALQEEISFANISHFASPFPYLLMHERETVQGMLKEVVKEKRYRHSLSVAETAEMLAKKHHVDPQKAYLAGLLHDMAKSFSEEENDAWLRCYDPEQLSAPAGIKHGYVACYYLQHVCLFRDADILEAIYHHSDGDCRSKLAQILYIADKREPLRGLEDGILQYAEKDLYGACRKLKGKVAEYLGEKKYDGKRS
ncbi:MAG: bis(5'-nucleosyl)-tetraphosphatase (symmetrical) YqeK [Erysipelotrichaceae bacterium]|nr:bis(5'-nucleosyl)-tetraphosphatase (symmetrical) YqeK [Erysipelotrichaceae bacterium]